jgi:hypothetical protein
VNRRGFLKGILATGVAPYVVTTAGVLMPVSDLWKPRGTWLWLLAADEQWNYFKIPTDLDSPVVFHEYTRILGAEAKVPGIGVLPVEASGGMRHDMQLGCSFRLESPKEEWLRISGDHVVRNPKYKPPLAL